MMSLQYQNLYDVNKTSSELDAYCRLEGLNSAYVRSMGKAAGGQLRPGIPSAFRYLFGKRTVREKGTEFKEVLE